MFGLGSLGNLCRFIINGTNCQMKLQKVQVKLSETIFHRQTVTPRADEVSPNAICFSSRTVSSGNVIHTEALVLFKFS